MASLPNQNHILIIEDDQGRKEFNLNGPVYSIGRDKQCNIRLYSLFVSRRHATLIRLPQQDGSFYYRIVDGYSEGQPSANGLLINGRKLPAQDLKMRTRLSLALKCAPFTTFLTRETVPSGPIDEWDVTLIGPNMMPSVEE
jgi:pSer/pThr/pTyr-binding forkhead associated (FHA) protein